ncbi:MAG: adenine phosphoribosyltransferase [Acidimicrobiia bacterium]
MDDLRALIRDVPDFPEPGIVFKDIAPLLGDAAALDRSLDLMASGHRDQGITHVAGIESRGFILATPVATRIGAGFIPIRKPGKLPWKTVARTYDLEYGSDAIEAHADAVGPGDSVLIVDDVLATGGTAAAAVGLMKDLGAEVVGVTVLIELALLGGRNKIDVPIRAVMVFED